MSADTDTIREATSQFLRAIHFGGRESRWLMVIEMAQDRPENAKDDEKAKKLGILFRMSLPRLMNLPNQQYTFLCERCGWLASKKGRYGTSLQFQANAFLNFLKAAGLEGAEYCPATPTGLSKRTHFVRLGNKDPGYLS